MKSKLGRRTKQARKGRKAAYTIHTNGRATKRRYVRLSAGRKALEKTERRTLVYSAEAIAEAIKAGTLTSIAPPRSDIPDRPQSLRTTKTIRKFLREESYYDDDDAPVELPDSAPVIDEAAEAIKAAKAEERAAKAKAIKAAKLALLERQAEVIRQRGGIA